MAIFIVRADPAPIYDDGMPYELILWLSILVDTLNQAFNEIEEALNRNDDGLVLPQYTTAQINVLAPTAADGVAWYCTDSVPPNVVVKINGALRQLDNSAFP